jgi:hypothetical protein
VPVQCSTLEFNSSLQHTHTQSIANLASASETSLPPPTFQSLPKEWKRVELLMPLVSIATILTAILSSRLALRISSKQQANYVTLLKEALEILCNLYSWRLTS